MRFRSKCTENRDHYNLMPLLAPDPPPAVSNGSKVVLYDCDDADEPAATHPLQPLSRDEIQFAATTLQQAGHAGDDARFISISLKEAPKEFLLTWAEGEVFEREAEALIYEPGKGHCKKAWVDLTRGNIRYEKLPNVNPSLTKNEVMACEQVLLTSSLFQSKLQEHYADNPLAQLGNLVVDVMPAGCVDAVDQGLRLARPLCYFKDYNSENPYAFPIEGLRPVVDLNKMELICVEDHGKRPLPPEHYACHRASRMKKFLRKDVKPLEIIQYDGPTFKVKGRAISWQGWTLVVGFNQREGVTLHDIRIQDRPVLYRGSLSELLFLNGDPSSQHAPRTALILGEYGIGNYVNPLKLGSDCLGEVFCLDVHGVNSTGEAWTVENGILIQEEDNGILWKHVDRHSGSDEVRRSRRLRISSSYTVENFDYLVAWLFTQDGRIEVEVSVSGFPAVAARHAEEPRPKYGELMAPQVYAPNFQHFFNFRLDFAIDGIQNSVARMEIAPEKPGKGNPLHNGFFSRKKPLRTEATAKGIVSQPKCRSWLIFNPELRSSLGNSRGYSLIPRENCVPFAHVDCPMRSRARFIDYHVWVTPYNDHELYATGNFPNQRRTEDGLPAWTRRNRSIEKTDLVLWYTLGLTQISHPESYPIMSGAKASFTLAPNGFFDRNPAQDVPPQTDVNNGTGASRMTKA